MLAYLFLADGFEEIEAVAVLDVLRRGGVVVESVGLTQMAVRGAHGIVIQADRGLDEVLGSEASCLIFPGGMPGSQHLAQCAPLMEWLDSHYGGGGLVAAICAAPAFVLSRLPMPLAMTCFPGCEAMLADAKLSTDGVVIDGRVVTARSAGYAIEFGLALVEQLTQTAQKERVAQGLWA